MKELNQSNLDLTMNPEFQSTVSFTALELLNKATDWSSDEIEIAHLILQVSEIMYNNTSITVLPLDDGLYDQLLVKYKRYDPSFQVGAKPIAFAEYDQRQNAPVKEKKLLYRTLTEQEKKDNIYIDDILKQHTPTSDIRPRTLYTLNQPPITKRLINTKHNYPELVGTLDKCKFVLNSDAMAQDAINNPSVQIFERDFIHPCLSTGVIEPDEEFEMIGELKYDGVSVEAEVCGDQIISALSRGDTADDIATDLTPILKGYRFYNASKVPKDVTFGIKFEAIITTRNLELLGIARGKVYKNARNAIIGLFGASDAYRYIGYITLIPISTSLKMDRIDELLFLNKYYSCGQYNRFCVFHGNYISMLFQVKQFTEAAELSRKVLPYMIDGVVISFTDPLKKSLLGRANSVNKYQMAIKFNPKEIRTIFLGYSYNIGKSGEVIPMVHFKPAEFIGTIHTKQTIHSFQRFKELALCVGQEIDVKYVNEVISYVTKPDTPHNRQIAETVGPEIFIDICPFCGSKIEISDSMKSARCPNVNCHERKIMRMVDMIDKLGFKDFSEETIRDLDLTEFSRLVTPYDRKYLEAVLGPVTSSKFVEYQKKLLVDPIPDYKIMAALSFEGMAEEKWKRILKQYALPYLFGLNQFQLTDCLRRIKGVGAETISSVVEGFANYANDVRFIMSNIHIINSNELTELPKVAITGLRDPSIIELINSQGYDCNDKYGVTKDITLLITSDYNSTSGKMEKAKKYGIPIMSVSDFVAKYGVKIN